MVTFCGGGGVYGVAATAETGATAAVVTGGEYVVVSDEEGRLRVRARGLAAGATCAARGLTSSAGVGSLAATGGAT